MLQDLFDELDVIGKAERGEVVIFYREWHDAERPKQLQYGIGTQIAVLRFVWPEQHFFVDAHCYITPKREIAASGMLDAKGIRYATEVRLLAFDPNQKRPD